MKNENKNKIALKKTRKNGKNEKTKMRFDE